MGQEEVIGKVKQFHDDTGSASISDLREHPVDLKPWQIYDSDLSWTEILSEAGVHWSDKNEYTKQDVYDSVEEFVLNNRVSSTAYFENKNYPTVYAINNNTNKTFNQIVGDIFNVKDIDESVSECSSCGGIYRNLSFHWRTSDCSYPKISENDKDILKGILMGDGCVTETNENCHSMSIDITRPLFLSWLDEKFPALFNQPRLKISSEDRLKKDSEDSLFGIDENREYKDAYTINSRVHPYFTKMRQKWYSDEGKVFPDDLELTPPLLKMWYVTDGGLSFKNGKDKADSVRIYTKNENHRLEYLCSLFDEVGLRNYKTEYAINIPAVDDFFEFIGKEHVPGFEYKWCTDNYEAYKRNKETYGSLSE